MEDGRIYEQQTSKLINKINMYNPIESVRRDFGETVEGNKNVSRNKKGKAVIENPDLKVIFDIYRRGIKEGTMLDLGAGPTHLHYMAGLEDKLTHISALDLSEKNLKTVAEFLDSNDNPHERTEYVSKEDLEVLRLIAEAQSKTIKGKKIRSGEEILKSIQSKSYKNGGGYDLIAADMHEIDKQEVLGDRKFDNIIIGFSLFVNTREQIISFLAKVKDRLNSAGRLIIADFKSFANEIIEDEEKYREDDKVNELYGDYLDFSVEALVEKYLPKAGFSKKNIKVEEIDSKTESTKDEKLTYFFVIAEKIS